MGYLEPKRVVGTVTSEIEDSAIMGKTPSGTVLLENHMLNLKYIKLPLTPKLLKRKEEEELYKKYNIPKKKSGKLL